jgi:hypothetical protein
MGKYLNILVEHKFWRHFLFWTCWVLGFTFIKSFGKAPGIYPFWLFYYLATLPLFMAHTYLVAYWLAPRYTSKQLLPVFGILFLLLFYGFSILEMWVSHAYIFRHFPAGSIMDENSLNYGNVIRNGLGNLYIVLVFLASKTIWDWSRYTMKQKELQQGILKDQMEETMTRVQPLMLIFAIDYIQRMVEEQSPDVSRAIAMTSELLSEVMIYHEEGRPWISREIGLVRKLADLVGVLRGEKPEVEYFVSGDPEEIDLPPMILFSFVDLLFRSFDHFDRIPEITIEASGFSNMISLQVFHAENWWKDDRIQDCMEAVKQLERTHGGRVRITVERHSYGCSVLINTTHTEQKEEYPSESAAC